MNYGIPNTVQIVVEARELMEKERPGSLSVESIRNNFSDSVETLFEYTHTVFQEYKKRALDREAHTVLDNTDKEKFTRDEVIAMISGIRDKSTSAGMSMGQSLISRTGNTLEVIVQSLLRDLGISVEVVTDKDKKSGLRRIDLVIPDKVTATRSPDKAHFLALKTSLRERWAQVVEQQRPGQRTHLLTLLQKETISNETATKITDSGIFLYVPDRVKDDRFADNVRIRRLSDLPSSVRP